LNGIGHILLPLRVQVNTNNFLWTIISCLSRH